MGNGLEQAGDCYRSDGLKQPLKNHNILNKCNDGAAFEWSELPSGSSDSDFRGT